MAKEHKFATSGNEKKYQATWNRYPEQQRILPQIAWSATNQDKMLPKQQKTLPETA